MPAREPVVDMVFRKLGGREGFGKEVLSEADLAHLVRHRLSLKVLAFLHERGGFSDREIALLPAVRIRTVFGGG
jgi:hypothetical protein